LLNKHSNGSLRKSQAEPGLPPGQSGLSSTNSNQGATQGVAQRTQNQFFMQPPSFPAMKAPAERVEGAPEEDDPFFYDMSIEPQGLRFKY